MTTSTNTSRVVVVVVVVVVASEDRFYVEFRQLQQLISISSNRCPTCDAPLRIVSQTGVEFAREGLCISIALGCATGRHAKLVWRSSPQYPSGGLIVNRLVVGAFFVCGVERNDFLEPHAACGMPIPETSYDRYIDKLEAPVRQQEEESYRQARSIANMGGEPVDLLIDGQWSNPQKTGRTARQCTNTSMIGTAGLPSVIIDQVHVTADSLET